MKTGIIGKDIMTAADRRRLHEEASKKLNLKGKGKK
jgi:hypothetical protein